MFNEDFIQNHVSKYLLNKRLLIYIIFIQDNETV